MKIVILAPADDNHTGPIKWALEQSGYQVACWDGLAWNDDLQASIWLGDQAKVALGPHTVEPGDVVWIRRPEPPAHNPKVSEADLKFARLEYRSFYLCLAYQLERLPVWCINRYSASRFVNNKAVQLLLAAECGMKTPNTLMSNNPRAVKDFLARPQSRSICKGFTPHVWQKSDNSVAVTETFELRTSQLPADEVLTYAPAIYQDMVEKEFDVRTVLMGNRVYSYALRNPRKALDWRQDAGMSKIEVEIIPTPPEVEKAILAFSRAAGVCFGSLDFAIDRQGQWWFLEINEQGQFLWLDQFHKEARLLEKFCAFITAPENSTQTLEEREHLFPSLAEYEKVLERKEVPPPRAQKKSPYMSIEA